MRFAHSPIRELVLSLRVLHDRRTQHMHGKWLSAVRGQLGGLRLELLTALAPTGRYLLAFMMPSPTGPRGVLTDELHLLANTSPAVVRRKLAKVREGRPLPSVLCHHRLDLAGSGVLLVPCVFS